MNNTTSAVRSYWEQQACGTDERVTSSRSSQTMLGKSKISAIPKRLHSQFAQFSRARGKTVLEVEVGTATDFTQWVRGARAHGVDLTQKDRARWAGCNLKGWRQPRQRKCGGFTLRRRVLRRRLWLSHPSC